MAAPPALIVANTSICTLLIVGRIWYMHYEVNRTGGAVATQSSAYKGALMLVIESGALYALAQLLSLILNHIKNIGLPILLDLEIPLIGILPTLILVIVHFRTVPGTRMSMSYYSHSHQKDASQPARITVNTFNMSRTITGGSRIEFKTGTVDTVHDDNVLDARAKADASHAV